MDEEGHIASTDDGEEATRASRHGPSPPHASKGAVWPLLVLLLAVQLAWSLYQLPLNRVVERRLCREYYGAHDPTVIGPDGSVDEELCKNDEIQQRLAWVLGAMETAWIVGDFVMTIPLGFMGEKYGQKAILWLNLIPRLFTIAWALIVGFSENLPLAAIVAGPILSILGGDCIFNSVTYALAAGLTDDYVTRFAAAKHNFLLTALASSDTKLLAQYISKRYHWTFASAGYLLTAKAVVNFLLLTLVIPKILQSTQTNALRSQPEVSDKVNVRYARICLAVSVFGALAIALAGTIWLLFPSLLFYALGSALPVFTLSLLKSPSVSPKQEDQAHSLTETHLFSIVMMTKTLGSLLGAPLMAFLWVRGIATGGSAMGTPYFTTALAPKWKLNNLKSVKVKLLLPRLPIPK
ncbi:hypothetical protein DL765_005394 [Monosporascus sp. GIB2]|nr:hypothetical protein DL765_005394 [Monosporascus sp. GIB2]